VPVTGNDPELLSKMMPTFNWAAGAENVHEGTRIMGAEDFSFYEEKIPGSSCFWASTIPLHRSPTGPRTTRLSLSPMNAP
jgi:amidohydrolase